MSEPRRAIVTEWQDEPPVARKQAQTPSRVSQRSYSVWIGATGSLLLHALLLQAVLLGARATKVHRPDVQGPGAAQIVSPTAPSETLVLLNLSAPVKSGTQLMEDLASAGSLPPDLRVTLISPDALPQVDIRADLANDDPKADAPIDSGDPAVRAVLFGRYTGQIAARIERAWRRPRSPVTVDESHLASLGLAAPRKQPVVDEPFKCQVRILQDRQGNLREVQLLQCNGSTAWRQSLVTAILTASPLPAPPSPTVFSDAMTLTFVGHAYTSDNNPDAYEPATAAPIQAQVNR